MRREIFSVFGLVAILVTACSPAASSPSLSTTPPTATNAAVPSHTAEAIAASATPSASASLPPTGVADPLVGDWDTGPYATTDYGGTTWEVHVRFYEEGGVPFVNSAGWDPTKDHQPNGDHGPYKVLPGNQLAFSSTDAPILTTLYSYKLSDDHLTIMWIKNDPAAPPGDVGGPFTTIHLVRQ